MTASAAAYAHYREVSIGLVLPWAGDLGPKALARYEPERWFEVWFYPKDLGREFGWEPKLKRVFYTYEGACECAYIKWMDDPARDAAFYTYVIITQP